VRVREAVSGIDLDGHADDVRQVALVLPGVVKIGNDGFDFRVADKGFVWSYPERGPGKPRVIRTDIAVLYVGDDAEEQALLLGEPEVSSPDLLAAGRVYPMFSPSATSTSATTWPPSLPPHARTQRCLGRRRRPPRRLRTRRQLADDIVILPKLFRRLAEYLTLEDAGVASPASPPS